MTATKKLLLCSVATVSVAAGVAFYRMPVRHDFFEFRNSSQVKIWVQETQGFDNAISCGILPPGNTATLAYMDAAVPKKAVVLWSKGDEPTTGPNRSSEIDLTSLKRNSADDNLVFEFLPNETWTARYEKPGY